MTRGGPERETLVGSVEGHVPQSGYGPRRPGEGARQAGFKTYNHGAIAVMVDDEGDDLAGVLVAARSQTPVDLKHILGSLAKALGETA